MKTTEKIAARRPMLRVVSRLDGLGGYEAVIDDPNPPPDVPPSLRLALPKLRWNHRRGGYIQIWQYFAAVERQLHAEAFVWLHWQKATATTPGEYVAVVPAFYTATSGGLTYPSAPERFCDVCQVAMFDAADFCPNCGPEAGRPTSACFLGDWHSHGTMPEFHSGTDNADEIGNSGVHLTSGRLHEGPTRVAHSFVVAEGPTRFTTTWRDHFEYDETEADRARLALWLRLIAQHDDSAVVRAVSTNDVVFRGTKQQCRIWIAGRRDGERFRVDDVEVRASAEKREQPSFHAPRSLSVVPPVVPPVVPRDKSSGWYAESPTEQLVELVKELPDIIAWWWTCYRLHDFADARQCDGVKSIIGPLPVFDCDPDRFIVEPGPDEDWHDQYKQLTASMAETDFVSALCSVAGDLLENDKVGDALRALLIPSGASRQKDDACPPT